MSVRIYIVAILLISLNSCSINFDEKITIAVLDMFEDQEDNEQFGMSLIAMPHGGIILETYPNLSETDLQGLGWEYFIREKDGQVSFRVMLSGESVKHKETLVEYFEDIIALQHDKLENESHIYESIENDCLKWISKLNNQNYGAIWSSTSDLMRTTMDSTDFVKMLKQREALPPNPGDAVISYKYYYESMPDIEEKDFYVICYKFENIANSMEQFNIHREGGVNKITRYDLRIPKN